MCFRHENFFDVVFRRLKKNPVLKEKCEKESIDIKWYLFELGACLTKSVFFSDDH